MHLTTVILDGSTRAGRVEGDEVVILDAPDVGAVFAQGGSAELGRSISFTDAQLAPMVTAPDKIVCVGVNYLDHVAEMGRD
ncbi:MAG: 2-hydroxyhepta-2,4-diene-1,7-dioate isomerase, partial [Acidimicrobiaceae bacterium]|nr:2-hydroxyhepta-2,4-diene-1,7-dioate isomerase [Acidimicrobiaceae bacterium]